MRAVPGFCSAIPSMDDLPALWAAIDHHRPIVLTGVPSAVEEAPENKRAWARRHLGAHVEVIRCCSREKSLYARPGDVLIDDWDKCRRLWIDRGGRWITHRSAADTITELRALGL